MDIEEESQVVVRVRMLIVEEDALLEMFDRVLIIADFEVGKTKVIVKLGVLIIDTF